ncbi:hypothetical protein AYJ09_01545 [Candidatus Liberibacter solanacearum]|uniref:hypothetical protein n=1 Tax=Candidatus Liberibacter solanacearum TaxID=556287 RepID=UPI000978D861|nr:hypothetical protein [Candidatus Liberibacter solanacearum]ONI59092.1 hypothetical protein AYJ09_01545 [Candidatus Liberibacter solanacearum]
MTKKYELTDETILFKGRTLHRIRALKDFGTVKAGDLGGFIESEENLSPDGECWIYDNAKVFDGARVFEEAQVKDQVIVCLKARIWGDSILRGSTWVSDSETFQKAGK